MASPSSALLSGPCVYCCATQGSARLPPLAWCSHELALKRPRTSNNNPSMPRQMIAQTNAIVTRVCVSACSARFRADTAASKSVGMISGLSEWPPVTLGESPFRHFDVDQRRRLCSCGWDYERVSVTRARHERESNLGHQKELVAFLLRRRLGSPLVFFNS